MDTIWDTYDQDGSELFGPSELKDFLKDLLTNVLENRKSVRAKKDEKEDHDHKFSEDDEDEEFQKQIDNDFKTDFERVYSLFDPDFKAKKSPGDQANPDKQYDGHVNKQQMRMFLQLMLLPDDDENQKKLDEVYSVG